jgi:hypothetical protein
MALTTDQQSQIDFAVAMQEATSAASATADAARRAHEQAMQAKQVSVETIRLAQQTLVENARSKPVDERDITAADITAFAATLATYINA